MSKIINIFQLFLLISNFSYALSECMVSLEEADKCGIKTSFFGNRDAIVPTSQDELDIHCQATKEGLKCVHNFINSCLKGFVKETSDLALTNGAKHLDKRCGDLTERKEFLKHIKCYTNKTKLESVHVCSDKNLAMLEIFLNDQIADNLGFGCCVFQFFQKCIYDTNRKSCDEETTEYWDEVINQMSEDSMSFTCAGFESLDKCEKSLKPDLWSQLKTIDAIDDPKALADKLKHKSGIALMIEFLKKLSNE